MCIKQESHQIFHLCIKYELEQMFSYPKHDFNFKQQKYIQRFRHFTDYLSENLVYK
jgi:hypothetical protein